MKFSIFNFQFSILPGAAGGRRWKFKKLNGKCAAFTLIEIMIVVAIIGLVAAMGLPNLMKALQKEGMRKAVSDVQDAFLSARERAIINQRQVAMVIYPQSGIFGVEGTTVTEGGTAVDKHSGKVTASTLPAGIKFAMLEIYRQDYVETDLPARIFFNADGTCDEAILVLSGKGEEHKITLDFATGLPTVSDVDK
jgi:prepilin-type N-terminal cleavage/methylation domain-containing protein